MVQKYISCLTPTPPADDMVYISITLVVPSSGQNPPSISFQTPDRRGSSAANSQPILSDDCLILPLVELRHTHTHTRNYLL